MLGKRVTLFKLFGFKVQADASWLFLAALIVWSLAVGAFPASYQGLSPATYWWMAVAATVGLFGSLVFHELSHSLVARRRGLPIRGITLFIFGGVAQMEDEPQNAKTEFLMAIAGPAASVFLALVFYAAAAGLRAAGTGAAAAGVVGYLAFINALLAGFNLLPAFPLDGGRVFRAVLWRWKRDMAWATRIASRVGEAFGVLLIVLGIVSFFGGNFIGGVWWFLIGMFLRNAAASSYQQLVLKRVLEGEPVRRFMTADPVTVPPKTTLEALVDDYIYRYHHDLFPVTADSRLVGYVGIRRVKEVPREQWQRRTVAEVLTPCSVQNTVSPDTDAVSALALMSRTGNSRLLVAEGDRLVGLVALKDLLKFLALKIDLGAAA